MDVGSGNGTQVLYKHLTESQVQASNLNAVNFLNVLNFRYKMTVGIRKYRKQEYLVTNEDYCAKM